MIRSVVSIATSLLLTLSACKSAPPPNPKSAQPDPTTLSQIEGTITLKGTPPTPLKIDTSMDPNCNPNGAPAPLAEQYVGQPGRLANVYLSIQSAPQSPPPQKTTTILDQKNCIYTPHVIAIQAGSSVEFHNSDDGMHNIETFPKIPGNQRLDTSQGPHGTPRTATFPHPEAMIPVRCNMHPWMNAFINVAPTPWFAISDAQGHFRIPNLPPGDYTLAAVHEVLGEQTLHLTIVPKSTTQANFTFNIAAPPQP